MIETMRTKINYSEISELLKTTLNLEGSPVAIKLVTAADQIPEGIKEVESQLRHCMMVNLSRREGAIFYATAGKHQCMGGAWSLGLRELTESLKSGEFYYKLGKFDTWAACKRTIDNIPHIKSGLTYATVYAPLEKTPFSPDVVLIFGKPKIMLKLAQSTLYHIGGRIHTSFSGIQSVCSEATGQTYLTGKPNYSIGCDGSRRYSGIADEEMVMGMPGEMLIEITQALKIVTAAPGSIK